jgi:hypothetical protein
MPAREMLRTELRELSQLPDRLARLEESLQYCRDVNRRVDGLTEAVVELLIPPADRDEHRLQELLRAAAD